MISLLVFLAVGALSGSIAGRLMKCDNRGCLTNIALGVVGAFVGNWLGEALGLRTDGFLHLSLVSVLSAVVGACLLIGVVRLLTGRLGKE